MQGNQLKPDSMTVRAIPRSVLLALAAALIWMTATPVASASATTERLGPFESAVIINDDPFSAAFVDCAFLQRTEHPDGSSIEVEHCQISELIIGEMPTTGFLGHIPSCQWASSYWLNTTGEPLFADSGRLVATPAGEVHVVTNYPADPDDLADCGFAD
jgi:hypothetical protein